MYIPLNAEWNFENFVVLGKIKIENFVQVYGVEE